MKFTFLLLVLSLLFGTSMAAAELNSVKVRHVEPDASVTIDRTYYGPGAIVFASIFDPDFNEDHNVVEGIELTQVVKGDPIVEVKIVQPSKGTLTLSAVDGSMRDSNGNPVTKAVESGPNTSDFEFEVKLPDDIEANSSVTVLFHDPFALTTSKPATPVRQAIDLLDTRISDGTGMPLMNASVGKKIIISSTLQNNVSYNQEYAYIVQVKDSSGVTVALGWISGYVEQFRSANAAVEWTPDKTGQYTVEIFVWQHLLLPIPLVLKPVSKAIVVS